MTGEGEQAGSVMLVDADLRVRTGIAADLEQAGFSVVQATTGDEAVAIAHDQRPRLVILEIALDRICDYELCRRFRQEFGEALPIIFLSGDRTESFDRVAGLLIGADDYLTKPVASDELLARVRRLLSKTTVAAEFEGAPLTSRELEVLELLADGLSYNEIAERLFDDARRMVWRTSRWSCDLPASRRAPDRHERTNVGRTGFRERQRAAASCASAIAPSTPA